MSVEKVLNLIKEKNIEWVDFRFTDIRRNFSSHFGTCS